MTCGYVVEIDDYVTPKAFTAHSYSSGLDNHEVKCEPDCFPRRIAEEFMRAVNGDFSTIGNNRWQLRELDPLHDAPDKTYRVSWHRGYSEFYVNINLNHDRTVRSAITKICGETGFTYGSQEIYCKKASIEKVDGKDCLRFYRIDYPDLIIPIKEGPDRWDIPDHWTYILCGELQRLGHPIDDDFVAVSKINPYYDLDDEDSRRIEHAIRGYRISEKVRLMIPGREITEKKIIQTNLGVWA